MLVAGGTGGFGRRLVDGLIATSPFDVIIVARNLERAEALARDINAGQTRPRARAVRLDVATTTSERLRALGAFVVADAAGPFQGAEYGLARAAIAAGLHYVDLADARDYVAGFAALDDAAQIAGVTALTGASSTPALSNAVLDRLTAGWSAIDCIEIAIAPGSRAMPRGRSVMAGVLSYAGKPVRVFTSGRWVERPGWGMLARRPMRGLGRRWLSLCETPDLDIVPRRFHPRSGAVFRAGLGSAAAHFALLAASFLVRARLLHSLAPLAGLFRAAVPLVARFGSDRGGMMVEATGTDAAGDRVRTRWTLLADAGDGPFVPTLPALAAIRALADGRLAFKGAASAAGVIDLAMIEPEFAPYRIDTQIETHRLPTPPSPFQVLLGSDFARLPEPVRRLHGLSYTAAAAGRAEVEPGGGVLAWLIRTVARLPRPGRDVPVTVSFRPDDKGGEYWRRNFAGRRYASGFAARGAGAEGRLLERFGPFALYHRLTPRADGLAWLLVEWRLLGVPLPGWTLPRVNCFESADGDRFLFDIDVRFPIAGPVIHYRGWLRQEG